MKSKYTNKIILKIILCVCLIVCGIYLVHAGFQREENISVIERHPREGAPQGYFFFDESKKVEDPGVTSLDSNVV